MSIKIAFVDDSRSVLKTLEILLKPKVQNNEYQVFTYVKPMEFLEDVQNIDVNFDILFFDINMPVLSGYDLLTKVRALPKYANAPIIAITTENSIESQEQGKNVGFDGWIVKINAPSTLVKAVIGAVEKFLPNKIIKEEDVKINKNNATSEIHNLFAMIEELNKKLLIAEENKSRFLSLIHNEFNNPLMSVTMLMRDIMEDKSKTADEIRDELRMIFVDILTLNSQLSNILGAAEVESTSGLEKTLTAFSMQDLLGDIIESQKLIYQDKEIAVDLKIELTEDLYNDRDKIFLIYRNLIENAFEFSPDRSKIKITSKLEQDKYLAIYVSNIGNHIKEQERMYDVFYQERSDFSRIHHGLGLGLAIVKYYSNFLGGLVVYSTNGEHNIFKVSIPLDPNAKDSEAFKFEPDNEGSRY